MTVSKTILRQLGGNRFIVMTGLKNFVGSNDALSLKIVPKPEQGQVHADLLSPMDVYTVSLLNTKGVVVSSHENV
jgi:hypothetical protein